MGDFRLKASKTIAAWGRRVRQGARGVLWDIARMPVKRPVFIVGCSRAGTTLVYKTFSLASELGTLNRETHDFWAELHPLAKRAWRSHALAASDASERDRGAVARYFFSGTGNTQFVDKNNQNGLCIPYLYALFSDAHFVYVKRSPGDNINSLIEGWGKPDEFGTWSAHLPEEVAVDGGRYPRWCFFLPDGWREHLKASIEEVCAFQYRAMNEAIMEARAAIPRQQWTEICYEDLVRAPVAVFRTAFQSARLKFGPAMEKHCATVLARPYNAFSEIRLDKWRDHRNRERIERVLPMVEETAKKMGYEV